MKRLIMFFGVLFWAALASAQVVPPTPANPPSPANPNTTPQNPNIDPANPNLGFTGPTTPRDIPPDFPVGATGATGYTGPTNIGVTGLSGEMNDQRNRNLDYNRNQRGITGPTGRRK